MTTEITVGCRKQELQAFRLTLNKASYVLCLIQAQKNTRIPIQMIDGSH